MKLFVCYAHDDAADLKPLDDCLTPMVAEGLISYWTDRKIDVGANWSDAIHSALDECDAGVFLLSMRFLASDFIRSVEKKRLLEHHQAGRIKVIPILLGECDLASSGFEEIQPLPGWNDFVHVPDDDQARRDRQWTKIGKKLRALAEAASVEIEYDGVPFPGLDSFDPHQAPIFAGREEETARLVELLSGDKRLLVLFGDSGSGKSSLAKAGVAPGLQARPGSDPELLIVSKPIATESGNPFAAFAAELRRCWKGTNPTQRDLAAALSADPSSIRTYLEKAMRGRGEDAELIVVIDQFEEIFSAMAAPHREGFIALVHHLVEQPRLRAILTVRHDFYGTLGAHDLMREQLNDSRCHCHFVGPLHPSRFPDIIGLPARKAGFRFEDGLVQMLIDDAGALGSDHAVVPLLAFALAKLSEPFRARFDSGATIEREERVLRTETYREFEGIAGAIGGAAKAAMRGVDKEVLARLARRLVAVTADGKPARMPVAAALLAKDPEVNDLAERLIRERLLVKRRDTVEVAHEALFTAWDDLAEWITLHRDALHQYYRLEYEAEQWAKADHNPHLLWAHERQVPLYDALARLERRREDLAEPMRTFARPEAECQLEKLTDPSTSHDDREEIGRRLSDIGDPRPGVGVVDGVPEIEWCSIPAGEVDLEGPRHVALASFEIAMYAVTNCQFMAFVEAPDGYPSSAWWQGLEKQEPIAGRARRFRSHPAAEVSWFEAMAFCRWLSARLGVNTEREIRLPTEAEWKWAAKSARADFRYPWGTEWTEQAYNTYESGLGRATAVGMYPADRSEQGVVDLAGNVEEWCLDKDETGPRDAPGFVPRVVRGGSWFDYRPFAYASSRTQYHPVARSAYLGFRVCRASPISSKHGPQKRRPQIR